MKEYRRIAGLTPFLFVETFQKMSGAIENVSKRTFVPFLVGIVPLFNTAAFDPEVAGHINKLNRELQFFIKKLNRFLNGFPLSRE